MKLINIILLFGLINNAYSTVDVCKIKTLWNYFIPKSQDQLLLFFSAKINQLTTPEICTITNKMDATLLSVILTREDFAHYTNDKQRETVTQFLEQYKIFADRLEYKFGGGPEQVPTIYSHLYEHILTESGRKELTKALLMGEKNLVTIENEIFEGYRNMIELEDIFNINKENKE